MILASGWVPTRDLGQACSFESLTATFPRAYDPRVGCGRHFGGHDRNLMVTG